jgi:penicillin-binding protein 2
VYLRTPEEQRPQIRTGFALRIAIMGGIALAMFGVIFFRLWYLQILSGDKYVAEANNNRVREIRVAAPRGEVLDRNGNVLVENRTSLALQLNPQRLPADTARRRAELRRLGDAAGLSLRRIRREMQDQLEELPSAPVTLKRDVDYELVAYLEENQLTFRGVEVQKVFVRRYPNGTLGAHLFGQVGEISKDELKQPEYRGLEPGDEIGKDGVEQQYDRYLRGRAGATRIQVDALGRPKGQLSERQPVPGNNLQLTIDSDLQAAGESALAARGLPGGFAAMNVHTGEVLGLGSFPSFDPSVFTRPLTQSQVDDLYRDPIAAPLTNRAIAGLYPTGSTMKPITSVAALNSSTITPSTPIFDGGSITIGDITFHNAGGAAYGTLSLPTALQVSSDVFFYTLGQYMNVDDGHGGPLQKWAFKLGLGHETGIDLPGESGGLIPTPRWRNRLFEKELTDRPWTVGDNVNLAVGQGDLQADPLQMAVAYAAIANGGAVLRPHVGMDVVDSAGRAVQEIEPPPQRHVQLDPAYRAAILSGLHDAAQSPGGTSYSVFGGFPIPVAGKTGTAERPGHFDDQSWYVVLAPYPDPRLVVAVTIEDGGFGVESAAPAALQILSQYFHARATSVGSGGGPLE